MITLRAGGDGEAKVLVKAKGPSLVAPLPPLALPMRVQLQGSHGVCFEALFDTPGVFRNDSVVFKGQGGAP